MGDTCIGMTVILNNLTVQMHFIQARLFLLLAVFGTLLALLLLLRGLVTLSLPAFAIRLFGVAGSTGSGLGFPVLLRLLLGELVRFPGNIEGLPENIDEMSPGEAWYRVTHLVCKTLIDLDLGCSAIMPG